MLNRHQCRERIVFALYQHLLLHKNLRETFADNFDGETLDDFLIQILNDLEENENNYICKITPLLNKWSFERLNYVEQAILLLATSENALSLNDKPIIINEAIELCKTYCDEESYKYINGVLDNL